MTTRTYAPKMSAAQQCIECDVWFAFDQRVDRLRQNDGRTFYCPNGHGQVYAETEADALKAALKATKDQLRASEREMARMRQRIEHGVCPHCNRHFANVERHMASKHLEE